MKKAHIIDMLMAIILVGMTLLATHGVILAVNWYMQHWRNPGL